MSRPRRNRRNSSSAAAQCGIIGLPDPGHDGLWQWARTEFAVAYDRFMADRAFRATGTEGRSAPVTLRTSTRRP